MAGPLAGGAEIAWRGDDASAEVVHPDAVGHDTGSQRIVLAGNRLGKLQTAAPPGEWRGVAATQNGQETPRRFLTRHCWVTAKRDAHVGYLRRILESMQHRFARCRLVLPLGLVGRFGDRLVVDGPSGC